MGPIEPKRIILDNFTIAANATAYATPTTIGLLTATESVDEELESNGTTIAEARPYSKVVGMKLQLEVFTNSLTAGDRIRWMLVKDVDNEGAITALTDAFFHTSNDDPTSRELRARTLAKGFLVVNDRTSRKMNIFIRRNTLKRLGSLRENDRFELVVASSANATCQVTGIGTIYVRHN